MRGECKIEQLKIGDRVKTVDGKLESVKWIGKQTLSVEHAHPLRALPVQVKAGALGKTYPFVTYTYHPMPLSLPRVSSQRQLPRTIAKRLNKVALNLYGQTAVR